MSYKRGFYVVLILLILVMAQTFISAETYIIIGTFTPYTDVAIRPPGCFDGSGNCVDTGVLPSGQMAIVYWSLVSQGITWGAIDPQQTEWVPMAVNGRCPDFYFGDMNLQERFQ